jgi:hypothetical protein
MALDKARGGGTFVLNLYGDWKSNQVLVRAGKMGWEIHRVQNWEELIEFARRFSAANYGGSTKA